MSRRSYSTRAGQRCATQVGDMIAVVCRRILKTDSGVLRVLGCSRVGGRFRGALTSSLVWRTPRIQFGLLDREKRRPRHHRRNHLRRRHRPTHRGRGGVAGADRRSTRPSTGRKVGLAAPLRRPARMCAAGVRLRARPPRTRWRRSQGCRCSRWAARHPATAPAVAARLSARPAARNAAA